MKYWTQPIEYNLQLVVEHKTLHTLVKTDMDLSLELASPREGRLVELSVDRGRPFGTVEALQNVPQTSAHAWTPLPTM
jgi:hypothetical protein